MKAWDFDVAFLSAEAVNKHGIWNSDEAMVAQQAVAMDQSRSTVFCLDRSKFDQVAPSFLVPLDRVNHWATDCSWKDLTRMGVSIDKTKLLS